MKLKTLTDRHDVTLKKLKISNRLMKGSFIVYSTNYVRKQKQDMKKT